MKIKSLAVIVGIGRRVGLVDNDLAAHLDVAGNPGRNVDADCAGRIVDLDRALIVELVVAVDDDAAARRAVHHTAGVDENIVRGAGLDGRSPNRPAHGGGNGRLRLSRRSHCNEAGGGKQELTHRDPFFRVTVSVRIAANVLSVGQTEPRSTCLGIFLEGLFETQPDRARAKGSDLGRAGGDRGAKCEAIADIVSQVGNGKG